MMPEGIETLLDKKGFGRLFAFLALDKPPMDASAKLIRARRPFRSLRSHRNQPAGSKLNPAKAVHRPRTVARKKRLD